MTTIVVVDRDRAHAETLALVLSMHGYSVLTVADPTLAWSRLCDAAIAVVVHRGSASSVRDLRRDLLEAGWAMPMLVVAAEQGAAIEGFFGESLESSWRCGDVVRAVGRALDAGVATGSPP